MFEVLRGYLIQGTALVRKVRENTPEKVMIELRFEERLRVNKAKVFGGWRLIPSDMNLQECLMTQENFYIQKHNVTCINSQ